jgi:hypothetical protein
MADSRPAWNEAGERLQALGQKLKARYEEQHGTDTAQNRQELSDAAKRVGGTVQDAFEALSSAAKDKSVQADIKEVGQSLYEALGATFGQVSEELRKTFSERKGSSVYDKIPDESTTPPATGPGSADSSLTGEPGSVTTGPAGGAGAAGPSSSGSSSSGSSSPGDSGPDSTPPKVEPWGTP